VEGARPVDGGCATEADRGEFRWPFPVRDGLNTLMFSRYGRPLLPYTPLLEARQYCVKCCDPLWIQICPPARTKQPVYGVSGRRKVLGSRLKGLNVFKTFD